MAAAGAVAAIAAIASAAVTAAGAIQQGKQQKAIAEFNAQVAENEAISARNAAQFEADLQSDRIERVIAAQRAGAGGAGVQIEGSPLAVIADTAADGELDRLAILFSGDIAAARATSQAAADRLQGRLAQTKARFSAVSALLGGASKAAGGFSGGFGGGSAPTVAT